MGTVIDVHLRHDGKYHILFLTQDIPKNGIIDLAREVARIIRNYRLDEARIRSVDYPTVGIRSIDSGYLRLLTILAMILSRHRVTLYNPEDSNYPTYTRSRRHSMFNVY